MSAEVNLFKVGTVEEKLIKAVLDSGSEISLIIPPEVTTQEIYEQLQVCCRAMARLENAENRLWPVIGRLLILCQENPDVWQDDYKDFKHFLRECVEEKLGLSRSMAYLSMQTMKKWPKLPIAEYSAVGISKFAVINRFSEQNGSTSQRLLNKAKGMTVKQLRTWAVETNRIERGEDTPACIHIGCNGAQRRRWENFARNPEVQKAAESDSPASILEALMSEFAGSYGIGEIQK